MIRKYDYFCPENGRTLEVEHSWKLTISAWGQLCNLLGINPGETRVDAPVQRLMSPPTLLTQKSVERRPGVHLIGCSCCGNPKMDLFQSKTIQAAKKDLKPLALED